jgi:hypothetical protein
MLSRLRRIATLSGSALLVVPLLVNAPYAHKHVDSDGTAVTWYPVECCHDEDCRPVAHIERAPDGLSMTTVDGITVHISPNSQRRRSLDTRWHVCVVPEEIDDRGPKVMCVFEPPNS